MSIIAVFIFYKHRKSYDPDEKLVYMEFFADLKDTPRARAYPASLLIRRVLFIAVIFFIDRDIDRTIVYPMLLSLQIPYLIIIVSNLLIKIIDFNKSF